MLRCESNDLLTRPGHVWQDEVNLSSDLFER